MLSLALTPCLPLQRAEGTDAPTIVAMQTMLARHQYREGGILSLAQGIVHWAPPESALAAARAAVEEPDSSLYTADDGLPALRAALREKVATENGLKDSEVMVTQGANQAYMNAVLTLLDPGDKVHHRSLDTAAVSLAPLQAVIFSPYYFNHKMALQLAGAEVVLGEAVVIVVAHPRRRRTY